MSTAHDSPLGKTVSGSTTYDPTLLFAIARAPKRAELGIPSTLPFVGVDIWNAYELSWLDARGKPQVAIGELRVPADSPNLIESKSLKLYLNSFNETRFEGIHAVSERMQRDLALCAGTPVSVVIDSERMTHYASAPLSGESIDGADIDIDHYGPPHADFLQAEANAGVVEQSLVSDLLKSNCPVTGQPDWASVQITYRGRAIDREGLLRYLISFRRHDDFHEQCVERIFVDVMARCAPERLTVHARYTRRGGLDINPWRSTHAMATVANQRVSRQ